MEDKNKIIIGKVGAPFGVDAWLKIYSYTEPYSNISHYKHWFLRKPKSNKNEWIKHSILEIKPHSKFYVAKLDGLNTREEAALLTNSYIAVDREELPELEEGEFYQEDLIGFSIFKENGQEIGIVKEFFNAGASDIMVVALSDCENSKNKELLIPFIEEQHILEVDLDNKRIKVDFEYQE